MARENKQTPKITYTNPDYPINISYTDLVAAARNYSGWECHEDIKIVIINHGTAQISFQEETMRLLPGQAVLIGRNIKHSIIQFGEEACTYYSITFHPRFILGDSDSYLSEKYAPIIDDSVLHFMVFYESIDWHNELLSNLNSLIVANLTESIGYELKTKAYLSIIWSILVEHKEDYKYEVPVLPVTLDEQRVKEAMRYIRDHHAEKLTLDDIAENIHISKSECCRCFKRVIAMTPFEYLIKHRIFVASNRLRDPAYCDVSIAEIAAAVGFNNFSYFSKIFGKYLNCTPRQYRSGASDYNPNTSLMSLR